MPGRYAIVCWVGVLRNEEETAQQAIKLLDFVVFGVAKGQGIVAVPGEVGVQVEPARLRPRRRRRERRRRADGAAPGQGPVGRRRRAEAVQRAPLPRLGHRVQEDLLRHGPRLRLVAAAAAAPLRRPPLRLHEDRPRRLGRAALPGAAADERRALRLLLRVDRRVGPVGGEPGGSGAEDPVPPPRHPARGRADQPVQPRRQPGRRPDLHPRVRCLAAVDLAALPADRRGPLRLRHGGLAAALLALRPLPGHGDHLVGGRLGPLLRDAR